MIKVTIYKDATKNYITVYINPVYIVSLRQLNHYCEIITTTKSFYVTETVEWIMEAISSK